MVPSDPHKVNKSTPDARRPGAELAYPGVNLEHVNRLIVDLERELSKAPVNSPGLQDLKDEIETLKNVIRSPKIKHGWIREGLHSIRSSLESLAGNVQYEVLKDAPYVAEIGRILGM